MNEPQEFAHSTNGDRWFIEPAPENQHPTVITVATCRPVATKRGSQWTCS